MSIVTRCSCTRLRCLDHRISTVGVQPLVGIVQGYSGGKGVQAATNIVLGSRFMCSCLCSRYVPVHTKRCGLRHESYLIDVVTVRHTNVIDPQHRTAMVPFLRKPSVRYGLTLLRHIHLHEQTRAAVRGDRVDQPSLQTHQPRRRLLETRRSTIMVVDAHIQEHAEICLL